MDSKYASKWGLSFSSLKDWKENTPDIWRQIWIDKTLQKPRKPATSFGSYLDCLVFTPKSLDKRFVVADFTLPSDKVVLIISDIFDSITEFNNRADKLNAENAKVKNWVKVPHKEFNLDDKEFVTSFTTKHDHYATKPDQAYNDILKKGALNYLNHLVATVGKTIITDEDRKEAEELKNILFTDPISKGFFDPKKDCEVIFQQPLYDTYEVSGFENIEQIPVKGLTDILHFNHKRKEVREVDLKCTESAFLFNSPQGPVKRFDYVGQHSFYDVLIRKWLLTYKGGEYKDYSVMNPLNVVIDRRQKLPYLYEYNPNDLHIKRFGIENTPIKGWEDTIHEIAFHLDCGDWSRPAEHIRNGKIVINAFNRR